MSKSRSQWLVVPVLGVICAVASLSQKTGDSSHFRIYVTNERSGDLSEIDASTFQVIATVPLGKRPRGIHASPDHRFLYIALSGSPIAALAWTRANSLRPTRSPTA